MMTLQNPKTVLFVSLIAAMILPFSGMSHAVAQQINNAEVVEEARQIANSILAHQAKLAEVEKNIENTDNPNKLENLEAQKARLINKITSLEDSLDEKFSVLTAQDVNKVDLKTVEASATTRSQGAGGASDYVQTSHCYGLINEDNECDSDMTFNGNTVSLIQPIDDYITRSCTGTSGICADFTYTAFDIPGWYQEGLDFYYYSSGYTNTCKVSSPTCSTWGVLTLLPDGTTAEISMVNAPTGTPMQTMWYLNYVGILWGQVDQNTHKQVLDDGYDPTP